VSLSVTVRGREFQVAGAEQRIAHLPKAVFEKGSESAGQRTSVWVRRMSPSLMFRLRYDGVEMVRTLNVNTINKT